MNTCSGKNCVSIPAGNASKLDRLCAIAITVSTIYSVEALIENCHGSKKGKENVSIPAGNAVKLDRPYNSRHRVMFQFSKARNEIFRRRNPKFMHPAGNTDKLADQKKVLEIFHVIWHPDRKYHYNSVNKPPTQNSDA